MIEKAISYQLTNCLRDNDLEESLPSAYKTFHSTETALLKVHNGWGHTRESLLQ